MNRFQAMAQIMAMLNEDHRLEPGSRKFKVVRQMIASKIDRLGPEGALTQVQDTRAHLIAQIDQIVI